MATRQLKYSYWNYVNYCAYKNGNSLLSAKIEKILEHPQSNHFTIPNLYYDFYMIALAMNPKFSKPKLQRIALESVLIKLDHSK